MVVWRSTLDSNYFYLLLLIFSSFAVFSICTTSNAQTTYTYDTYTDANYAGTPNAKGRLTSVTDPTGTTTFFYDARGNITKTIKVIEGNSFTVQSNYDSLNRTKTTTYPDNEVVTYGYDAAGNIQTVTGQNITVTPPTAYPYVSNIQYNAFNQRTKVTFGNSVSTAYSYDPSSFRLSQICSRKNLDCTDPATTPALLEKVSYTYDASGNVTAMADSLNAVNSQTFTYDELNRLKTAIGPYGDLSSTPYTYDPMGNMTYNPQMGSYKYLDSGLSSVRPHAVVSAGSYVYSYDTNGNMISSGSYDGNGNLVSGTNRALTYDTENRPISITQGSTTLTMAYDYNGDRVKKADGLSTIYYVGKLYEKKGTVTTKYIFAGPTRVALKSSDGTVYFYHPNHISSTHLMTDTGGSVAEEIKYNPYGSTLSDPGVTGGINVNHKYTSQEFDSQVGLYYYRARYYDAGIGRFISADTLVPSPRNPQFLNRYSYAVNNPVRNIDPTGHVPFDNITTLLGGSQQFRCTNCGSNSLDIPPPTPSDPNNCSSCNTAVSSGGGGTGSISGVSNNVIANQPGGGNTRVIPSAQAESLQDPLLDPTALAGVGLAGVLTSGVPSSLISSITPALAAKAFGGAGVGAIGGAAGALAQGGDPGSIATSVVAGAAAGALSSAFSLGPSGTALLAGGSDLLGQAITGLDNPDFKFNFSSAIGAGLGAGAGTVFGNSLAAGVAPVADEASQALIQTIAPMPTSAAVGLLGNAVGQDTGF